MTAVFPSRSPKEEVRAAASKGGKASGSGSGSATESGFVEDDNNIVDDDSNYDNDNSGTSKRGFASMDPDKQVSG